MSDAEFESHVGVESGEVDDDMCGAADLIPDRAGGCPGPALGATNVNDTRAASLFDDLAGRIGPGGTEGCHVKAALSCRIRIAAGPCRQRQLRRFRAEVAEHRSDKQPGFDRVVSGVVIDGREGLAHAESP